MSEEIAITEREQFLFDEISKIYNSGDLKLALDKSIEFLSEFPNSYMARYKNAVMHGDYSYSLCLSTEEQKKYREIGNQKIKEMAEDPELKKWPKAFQFRIRNEYYWFFEMPLEQYQLGLEKIALGEKGDYSATVGASMMALRSLKAGDIASAEDWAQKSLYHFKAFEEYAPHWYNINIFAAQAMACLGMYDEAISCYKDMFRKQEAPINDAQVLDFSEKVDAMRDLRKK